MNEGILLRYNEVALKGANRSWFERHLAQNAREMAERAWQTNSSTQSAPKIATEQPRGRIILKTPFTSGISEQLKRTFGLSSFSPIHFVPTDLEAIVDASIQEVERALLHRGINPHRTNAPISFRVTTRRSDKALPQTSPEIDAVIGSAVLDRFGSTLQVRLARPELELGVEVRRHQSFVWTEKFSGPGGLPVGTNAHLLTLLSGGIDSPVAAIHALKRGSRVSLLHFDGTPFVGPEALEKVESLADIIRKFSPIPIRLYSVPFGKIQENIALMCPPKLRTILYRRLMLRIANRLARIMGAHALVTGESVGQVASQTVENLATIDQASEMAIIRPLVSLDKEEIIAQAQHWGTYETSILPAADCCTLFADRNPAIRSNVAQISKIESLLPIETLTERACNEVREISRAGASKPDFPNFAGRSTSSGS